PTKAYWSCTKFGSWGAMVGPMIAIRTANAITAAHRCPTQPVPRRPGMPRRPRATASVVTVGATTVLTPCAPPSHCRTAFATVCKVACFACSVAYSLRLLPEGHARIEQRVQDVDHHVRDHERRHQHQRDALDDGEVLRLRGLHEVGAEAVQVERP